MPLVTAADFPGINATPDNSGLAEGIFQALHGVGQRAEQRRVENAALMKGHLKTTGAQFARIAGIKDFQTQKGQVAILGRNAARDGMPTTIYEDALAIEDQDLFNLHLAKIVTRATDADKLLEADLEVNKLQFGGQEIFEDENGNQFFGTTRRDSTSGAVEPVFNPIGHNEEPGKNMQRVSRSGLTPETKVEQIGEIEGIKTDEIQKRKKAEKEIALDYNARIASAVEEAKVKANEKGTQFTELEQMEASLPLLQESIAELRDLSEIATYTTGGKVFDTIVKESGFGATEGATARAKFIAIVNNQVLPLLKPTFGAAFTVQEGESLKATMGDPDATPEAKQAQLEAFIAQKERNIRAKQEQLNPTESSPGGYPEGTIIENPSTGETLIKRGGEWVPS